MSESFDLIVLGCGGVGSAALYEAARRGVRALGLDPFPPAHDRGSSHGRTRIIRQAYFEHPDYVPLVLRAFDRWRALEEESGRRLYRETGLLQVGPALGDVISGVLRSAQQHHLQIDRLTTPEVEQRFPGFRCAGGTVRSACADLVGVFERRAGCLLVEACVQTHLDLAVRHGAELRTGHGVREIRYRSDQVEVVAEQGTFVAPRLVVATGAWSADLLGELRLPLVVRRKPQYWFATEQPEDYAADGGSPAFLFETAEGVFYGFPQFDANGVKMAEHSGGQPVSDPTALARDVDPHDLARVTQFAQRCLPRVTCRLLDHAPCMYTLSPDEHFIVDRHPHHPQVAFAAGLSGHGFKFAGVLGEALVDLALDGATALPIGFLSLRRFAATK